MVKFVHSLTNKLPTENSGHDSCRGFVLFSPLATPTVGIQHLLVRPTSHKVGPLPLISRVLTALIRVYDQNYPFIRTFIWVITGRAHLVDKYDNDSWRPPQRGNCWLPLAGDENGFSESNRWFLACLKNSTNWGPWRLIAFYSMKSLAIIGHYILAVVFFHCF